MMPTYRTLCKRARKYAVIGHAYRRWYRVARAVIRRLSDQGWSHISPLSREEGYETLCDLVAITSPRVSVKRNLKFAWGEYTGRPRPSDMIRSTRAALDYYYRTNEIRGPKTSRFAAVLRGADNVVVVDTWMARSLSVPDNKARNRTTQTLAEQVIGHVARAHAVPLSDAQAMVWAGIIRTFYKDGKVPLYRTCDVGLYSMGNTVLSDIPF